MRCKYQYKVYIVKQDENLVEFCSRNNLNILEIRYLNNFNNSNESLLGKKIKIPCELCSCKKGFFYRLKKSETIMQICKKNKISLESFLDANPYFNINSYIEGQIVIIPHDING